MIAISFSLKGQSLENILPVLNDLAQKHKEETLVHAFMPRAELVRRNYDTGLVDALDGLFPFQRNFFNIETGGPLRTQMAEHVAKNRGTVYIIGELIDGVNDEAELYESAGAEVVKLPLGKGKC